MSMILFHFTVPFYDAVHPDYLPGAGVCEFKGDPHYFQFDAGMGEEGLTIQSTCSYILVKTNCSKEFNNSDFHVIGKFDLIDMVHNKSSIQQVDAFIMIDDDHDDDHDHDHVSGLWVRLASHVT